MHSPNKTEKVIHYKQKVSYPIILRPTEDNGCCYLEVPDFDIKVFSSTKQKALAEAKHKLKQKLVEDYKYHVKLPAPSFLARPYDIYKYGDIWSSITVTLDIPFEVWRSCCD